MSHTSDPPLDAVPPGGYAPDGDEGEDAEEEHESTS